MKHLDSYQLFESADDGDKYLLNLSSANSYVNVERWINDWANISDTTKTGASRWSLSPELDKIARIPMSLRNLSNHEIANQIKVRGIGPMRLRREYDQTCEELLPQLRKIFAKFKSLPIEKKVAFMVELNLEDYVFCTNSDIIKVIDRINLTEELEVITSKLHLLLLD